MPSSKQAKSSRRFKGEIHIDEERCKGCGFCIEFCPVKALGMSQKFNSKGYHVPVALKPDDCVGCNLCGLYCPDFAIYSVRITEENDQNDEGK